MHDLAVQLASEIFVEAVPFAFIFGVCELIFSTFFRAAFGGRLWFGK